MFDLNDSNAVWPPGFFLRPRVQAVAAEVIEAYKGVPSTHVSDVLGRHTGARGLRPYTKGAGLCGPAITVKVRPGDNLMIHAAILMSQPGDVIVVDGSADLSTALVGGLMRAAALSRRLGGFVIDGAIRDLDDWALGGVPLYAAGISHRGPSKVGPGQVNLPIACAGMVVEPGDLVIGDADGVIVINAKKAAEILPLCLEHARREDSIMEKNIRGELDLERFKTLLRNSGCPV